MKKSGMILAGLLVASAALAETTVFTEDFDGWANGRQIDWDDNWHAYNNTGKGKATNDVLGVLAQYGGAVQISNSVVVGVGESVNVKLQYQPMVGDIESSTLELFGFLPELEYKEGTEQIDNGAGSVSDDIYWLGPMFSQAGYDPDDSGGGSIIMRNSIFMPNNTANRIYSPAENFGITGTNDLIGDIMDIEFTLTKTTVEDVWFMDMSYSNTVSGAAEFGSYRITDSNTYDAAELWFGFNASGALAADRKADHFIDNIVVTHIPAPPTRVIIDEDFNRLSGSLSAVPGWIEMKKDSALMVQDGVAQSYIGQGIGGPYRGVSYTAKTLNVATGETVRIEFDWAGTIEGDLNQVWCDVVMTTNAYDDNSKVWYFDSSDAMGVQLKQTTFNDTVALNTAASGGLAVDMADLALDPVNPGSSDACRITFEYLKTETNGVWNLGITVSNRITGIEYAKRDLIVVNSNTYDADELYFGISKNADVAYDGGSPWGFEMDNLVVEIVPVPGPAGFDGWYAHYELTEGADGDDDDDGLSNLYEYGLGGDPTDDRDQGNLPSMVYGGDDTVTYYNVMLSDPDAGIEYIVEQTTDLESNPWTASGWSTITNYPSADPDFDQAEHRISGGDKDQLFFRLRIVQP
ncbi:hypothetical protein [Pontiella agarivorans]|uniref:Uncharacterized protein n=1 Tax=Pontiella agarivorans TaxID=3038953 RepID=A0ABU5MY58_9BACT|nr:hypothetical protein [Pontiella agarivorans]MDZ8119139.1 hypothetical protein [Pontiella agarivorans]